MGGNSNKIVYHNNKSKKPPTHGLSNKALHVDKVLDCFWFYINQLVYISDAKACAEYRFEYLTQKLDSNATFPFMIKENNKKWKHETGTIEGSFKSPMAWCPQQGKIWKLFFFFTQYIKHI